jgi:tRNA pseudouridine55 synthase
VGLYVVDKPIGRTSHDVVAAARRALGTKRVGHTGTLDPLATGVLVLAVGESTKLVQFLETDTKSYLAFVSFGASTPTLDAEGPILETAPTALTLEDVRAALPELRGTQTQRPPAYSAIHVDGQRAYDLARAGRAVEPPARTVTVSRLEAAAILETVDAFRDLTYAPGMHGDWLPGADGRRFTLPAALGTFQTVLLNVTVSSGTYIRSLARDLGTLMGVPAHLSGLVRTRVGAHALHDAVKLEELAQATPSNDLDALTLPRLQVDAATARRIRDGKRVEHALTGRAVVTQEGALVAVVDGDGTALRVVRAWQ